MDKFQKKPNREYLQITFNSNKPSLYCSIFNAFNTGLCYEALSTLRMFFQNVSLLLTTARYHANRQEDYEKE